MSIDGHKTRLLVFSPYALWDLHTAFEGLIARACRVRGASVEYLLCDGLLPECDQHWDSKNGPGRPADLCARCQATSRANLSSLRFPSRLLGEFVSREERRNAAAWAQTIKPEGLLSASYEGNPLGEWVLSSVISYFRQYPPDLENSHVVDVFRGFLSSAAIVASGLTNYLEAHAVDSALLFNGRQSITRVALELFRQRGIRVLTHERGEYRRAHLNARPNAHCMSFEPFRAFWDEWGTVPLQQEALESTLDWLVQRRYGVNLAWIPFNKSFRQDASIRSRFGLDPGRKLWALFTSSTDETAGDPAMRGPFESQGEWVREVIQWVASRNDVDLVIKVHPNLGGNEYIGKARSELQIYLDMKATMPENVHLILPEDSVNAYALTDEADVGLTFGSTIGLEMAMLGKPVLLASRALYECASRIFTVRSRELLRESLEACLRAAPDREIQRQAFRLAHYFFQTTELPVRSVSVRGLWNAEIHCADADLVAGKDPSLDRISAFLLDESSFFPSPPPAERARTTEQEDEFFDRLSASPNYLRDSRYERDMHVTVILCTFNRCESLARSLDSVAGQIVPDGVEWELLVVDNNSSDRTHHVVEQASGRYPGRIRYLFEPRQGKSHALNTGIRNARGRVLAFVDDDVTVAPDWLDNLTSSLRAGESAGTGGRIVPEKGFQPPRWLNVQRHHALAPFAFFDLGPETGVLEEAPFGTNMAFRREMFDKYGDFRVDLGPRPGSEIRDEDTEFGQRLLYFKEPLRYEPAAIVYHPVAEHRLSPAYFLAWYYGQGQAQIRRFGIPPGIAVGRVPLMLLRRLVRWTLQWMMEFRTDRRFDNKITVWRLLGQIAECRSRNKEG